MIITALKTFVHDDKKRLRHDTFEVLDDVALQLIAAGLAQIPYSVAECLKAEACAPSAPAPAPAPTPVAVSPAAKRTTPSVQPARKRKRKAS